MPDPLLPEPLPEMAQLVATRGVCRVYELSIGGGEWRLWREGEPFPQRFTGRFEDDGNTIAGRREKADDGSTRTTAFDLTYRKVD